MDIREALHAVVDVLAGKRAHLGADEGPVREAIDAAYAKPAPAPGQPPAPPQEQGLGYPVPPQGA